MTSELFDYIKYLENKLNEQNYISLNIKIELEKCKTVLREECGKIGHDYKRERDNDYHRVKYWDVCKRCKYTK